MCTVCYYKCQTTEHRDGAVLFSWSLRRALRISWFMFGHQNSRHTSCFVLRSIYTEGFQHWFSAAVPAQASPQLVCCMYFHMRRLAGELEFPFLYCMYVDDNSDSLIGSKNSEDLLRMGRCANKLRIKHHLCTSVFDATLRCVIFVSSFKYIQSSYIFFCWTSQKKIIQMLINVIKQCSKSNLPQGLITAVGKVWLKTPY